MTTPALTQTAPSTSSYREKTLPLTGLRWTTDGRLLVTSDETAASLHRRAFSVSAGQAIAQCQAKWLASQVVPREDDPLQAAPLGVHAHSALESFYRDVPAPERTKERLQEHVRRVFLSPEFRADQERLDPDGRITQELKVMDFALGVLELEDPTKVNVIEVERRFKAVPLNTFLNLNGFIDRVERLVTAEADTDGEVEITDYKTGKYEKFNPDYGNRDEKADQIRIYGRGYEMQTGIRPTRGQLLYTGARARTEVDMSVEATDDSVQWLTEQYQAQQRAVEAREFTTNPGPLCAWCPLVNACPVGQIGSPKKWTNADKFALELSNGVTLTDKRRAWMLKDAVSLRKAVTAADGQFSPEQLGIEGSRAFKPNPVVPPLILAALEAEEAPGCEQDARARIETSPPPPPPAPLIQEIHAMTMTTAPQQATQQMPQAQQQQQQQLAPRPEGRPFDEIVNGPGGTPLLNLNSYAATGVFGLVGLAGESLTEAGVAAPTPEQTLALARVFARMVQRAEAGITGGTGWSSGANTRIRGLLRSVLEQRPLPVGAGTETWTAWYQTNGPYLMTLARTAMTVWDDEAISQDLLMESLGVAATAQKGGPFA